MPGGLCGGETTAFRDGGVCGGVAGSGLHGFGQDADLGAIRRAGGGDVSGEQVAEGVRGDVDLEPFLRLAPS